MDQIKIPTVIMRGGTSKAVFLKEDDLPKDKEKRDEIILRIFGSPDKRQIDGLGGADPLTSKLAIIGPSSREDADVDYTFGQVSFVAPTIDYSGNCGNISSAVGPYVIDEGLIEAKAPITKVRVHNTNTNKILVEEVEVVNGKAKTKGDYAIDGVPGYGSKISIDFSDTAGSKTGKLLPTGNVTDKIQVNGFGEIIASIVDAANPMVFIKAVDLKLNGRETPEEINSNNEILKTLEEIRGKAALKMGLVQKWEEAEKKAPAFPMIAFVSPVNKDEENFDFISRLMFMQVMHKTYAGTGTICTGSAARIKGTVVNQVMEEKEKGQSNLIKIGHPAGFIEIDVTAEQKDSLWYLKKAAINRTARRIMDGNSYIPKEG